MRGAGKGVGVRGGGKGVGDRDKPICVEIG